MVVTMSSFSGVLYKVLDVLSNNAVRNFLKSFGIGIGSGAAMYLLISTYIQTVVSKANSMPYLSLLSLFGIDAALSIILGAILTRATYLSTKATFTKK